MTDDFIFIFLLHASALVKTSENSLTKTECFSHSLDLCEVWWTIIKFTACDFFVVVVCVVCIAREAQLLFGKERAFEAIVFII